MTSVDGDRVPASTARRHRRVGRRAARARRGARRRGDGRDARGERADQGRARSRDALGLLAVADDTGLEVDALDGAPGVLLGALRGRATRPTPTTSPSCSRELEGVYPALRTARFATVAIAALARRPRGRRPRRGRGRHRGRAARRRAASATTRCSCRSKATAARLRR